MKLYTEEQVKEVYLEGWNDGQNDNIGYIDRVIESLTPIELPSDEEIEKKVDSAWIIDELYRKVFISGAKWVREQILNQNK